MWFLYLVCLIIVLIIDYIIAKEFSDIAEMKGHKGSTYFWFTFVFSLVGMLMVIALPNIKEVTIKNMPTVLSSQTSTIISQEEITASNEKTTHSWRCAACNNMRTKSPCEHCGNE